MIKFDTCHKASFLFWKHRNYWLPTYNMVMLMGCTEVQTFNNTEQLRRKIPISSGDCALWKYINAHHILKIPIFHINMRAIN